MSEDQDLLVVARAVIEAFGADAPRIMESRALAHICAGESEGAEFWRSVADAVRRILGECPLPDC